MTAMATLVGFIFSREKKGFTPDLITVLTILFCVHFTLTTFTALNPQLSWTEWSRTSKIFLMTFLAIFLFRDRNKLHWLILVVTFSAAFYGVKGGFFTIATGGQYMVWGPDESFFGGNTGLALVLNMILPFLLIPGMKSAKMTTRCFYLLCFFLTVVAIVGTYSRGGLVGLAAVMLAMFVTLPITAAKRLSIVLALMVAVAVGSFFVPQQWYDRMKTITTYEQDASSMGRINAWWFAYNLANDRPLVGGGFSTYTRELFLRYAPDPEDFHDSHSIFFEVLADHGYVGLLLYLAIIACTVSSLFRLKRVCRSIGDLGWANDYATMVLCSIAGYLGNGLTLGLAYFDLFWLMISMTICLKLIVRDHIKKMYMEHLAHRQGSAPGAQLSLSSRLA